MTIVRPVGVKQASLKVGEHTKIRYPVAKIDGGGGKGEINVAKILQGWSPTGPPISV